MANRPAVRRLLNYALAALLSNTTMAPAMLVDLFTLMGPRPYEGSVLNDPRIFNEKFGLALNVVETMPTDSIEDASLKETLQRIVWRRAMILDDWTLLNETAMRSDEGVAAAMGKTALYRPLLHVAEQGQGCRL